MNTKRQKAMFSDDMTNKTAEETVILPPPLPSFFEKTWIVSIDWFRVFFWGTVILATALRFYDLGSKPLHHDESLYSTYCWKFFTGDAGYKYTYDPMMHGPFMFHFQLVMYFLFGVSDFSTRIAPALFGTLMVAITYYLKDFIGKIGVIAVALLLTLSPTHLYFSRFMREDSYSAFFVYASAVFGLLYCRTLSKKHLYLCAASLSLMFCVKENSYIHLFIFVTFFMLKEFCQTYLFRFSEYADNLTERIQRYVASQQYPLIFAGFIALWIYLLLYTTFFTNPGGFLDGIYRKSLTYWWGQHKMQRIKGPFHYYVPFFFLYELPVLLMVVTGVLYKISNTLNKLIIAVWATVFSLILVGFYGNQPLPQQLAFTHMEIAADLILTVYISGIGLWATFHFLQQRQHSAALFVYWTIMGFLIYSYAGEKVPWLLLHIILPMIVLSGIFLNEFFASELWQTRRRTLKICSGVIGSLFGLYLIHTTFVLNYCNQANPVERMVYTQTSTDILRLMKMIEDVKFGLGPEKAKEPIVAVRGNATWPLHWYLRDYNGWFFPGELEGINRPMVIIDWEEREKYQAIFKDNYQEIRVKLREWWVPQPGASLKDWWNYFIYRKVFNPTGSSDIAVYIKQT